MRETGFEIVTSLGDPSNPRKRYRAVELGCGNYAQVYLGKIKSVDRAVHSLDDEYVAIKLFNDEAKDNLEDIFAHEVEHLRSIGHHDHIVSLHGSDSNYPPTIICEECGSSFHLTQCPLCDGEIANLVDHSSNRRGLLCKSDTTHLFLKDRSADLVTLAASRPCGHSSSVTAVNFLFRPCIVLELLDLNLDELQQLLLHGNDAIVRSHRIRRTTETDEEWQRQVFLIGLWCLSQAAEGLAYVHSVGRLHGDISPQNIMVTLQKTRYTIQRGAYPIHHVCLIDLGEARAVTDRNLTRPVGGKSHFIAPERTIVESVLPGPMVIMPEGDAFAVEGFCGLEAPLAVERDLLEGDIVRDQHRGEYIVAKRLANKQGRACYRLRIIRPPAITASAAANTKFQMRMDAALRIPIDLYGFGCLAAWLLSGGQYPIVDAIKVSASEATESGEAVDDAFLERFLRAEKRQRLLGALALPGEPEDLQLRERLLLLVFRCLVRSAGAYAPTRVDCDAAATVRLASDLRQLYDDFYFWHRSKPRMREWLGKEKQIVHKINNELRRTKIHRNTLAAALIITTAILAGVLLGTKRSSDEKGISVPPVKYAQESHTKTKELLDLGVHDLNLLTVHDGGTNQSFDLAVQFSSPKRHSLACAYVGVDEQDRETLKSYFELNRKCKISSKNGGKAWVKLENGCEISASKSINDDGDQKDEMHNIGAALKAKESGFCARINNPITIRIQ